MSKENKELTLIQRELFKDKITLTKTGLKFPEEKLLFEEWEKVGALLKRMRGSVLFWIGDWINYGEHTYGEMYAQALDETDFTYQTLQDAVYVASNIEFSRRLENLSWSHHREVASLEPKKQDEFLSEAEKNHLTREELRKAVREFKKKDNKITNPLPEGLYDVIVIDPPWPYGTEYDGDARRVASPYPELPIEELSKLKLPSAPDNCVLWLWTTHKFIQDSLTLAKTWGFEHKIILAWDKVRLGVGSWMRCQTEFCLLCIKGTPEWNLTNQRDVIRVARREHSRKPNEFYEMVKKLCPGKRVDMFSRERHDGFDGWGNESEKFDKQEV